MHRHIDFAQQVFTVAEAAEFLRLSRSFLYVLARDGKLRFQKVGSRSLISGAEIARFRHR